MPDPILPAIVPFQWKDQPVVSIQNNSSTITAKAEIDGKIYTIIHRIPEKHISNQEAQAALQQLTDKIILMKTRYLYEDVVSLKFNEKDQEVERTYRNPLKHNKRVTYSNKFNYEFGQQLTQTEGKLQKINHRSDKYLQVQNRIERIKETQRLYDYLRNKGVPVAGNDHFTLERTESPKVLPPPSKVVPEQQPAYENLSPLYREQQARLEMAEEMYSKMDHYLQGLEEENRQLKHKATSSDKALLENEQKIEQLRQANADLEKALSKVEKEKEELHEALIKYEALFSDTKQALQGLEQALQKSQSDILAARRNQLFGLQRFENELKAVRRAHQVRLDIRLREIDLKEQQEKIHQDRLIDKKADFITDQLFKLIRSDKFDQEVLQAEKVLIAELHKILIEKEENLQKVNSSLKDLIKLAQQK